MTVTVAVFAAARKRLAARIGALGLEIRTSDPDGNFDIDCTKTHPPQVDVLQTFNADLNNPAYRTIADRG